MQQSPTRIRWHRPLMRAEEMLADAADEASPAVAERAALRSIVQQVGIPVVVGAVTARDYAIGLLKLAAEVEQALMVQYLYAAFSVPNELGPDSVNYHLKLMKVAIQEMGHLATVQNLLLLVGGRDAFYLQRDLIREASEKNPIPFVLEKISRTSLAKYVAAEKPSQVPPELSAKVDELVKLAEEDAGVEPHRVGVIYELLKWVFSPPGESNVDLDFSMFAPLPKNPHLSDADLQDTSQVVSKYEGLAEEWQVFVEDVILVTAHNCMEARDAIDLIAKQGEGLDDTIRSHFAEFMEMVKAFEAGNIVVKPIAKSPTLSVQTIQIGDVIMNPYTKLWCEVFNFQYNLLVLTIYHTFLTVRPDDGSPGLRAALANLALFGMRRVIHPLADLITALDLRADGSLDKAGPPFNLESEILHSNDDHELVGQHIRLLDSLASVYSDIQSSPDFTSFPDHSNTLANLRNFDKRRRDLFPPSPPTHPQPIILKENKS
jgi:rubrerythrin